MHSPRTQALHHSLKLRGHAAEMRARHNAAKIALWQLLRAGQQGAWFRRQVVLLGSCIVDFYCPAAKLVVEVDGAYHAEPARKRADARTFSDDALSLIVRSSEGGLRKPETSASAPCSRLCSRFLGELSRHARTGGREILVHRCYGCRLEPQHATRYQRGRQSSRRFSSLVHCHPTPRCRR
jgi:uncharacterized protein DUF559